MRETKLFRVFTPKGRFHLTIEADSWEQAEHVATEMFRLIKLEIKELRRAKHYTGDSAEGILIFRADSPDYAQWRGMSIYAGKNLWRALGMGVLFKAQLVVCRGVPKEE